MAKYLGTAKLVGRLSACVDGVEFMAQHETEIDEREKITGAK